MKNRFRLLGLLLTIVTLALSACQSTPTKGTGNPTTVPGIYPAPGFASPATAAPTTASGAAASPATAAPTTASAASGSAATAYPGPVSPSSGPLTWEEAKAMILNGEVASISLSQTSLVFSMTLKKNGLVVSSEQPAKDEVLNVLTQCGDKCKYIQQ
jgi:hypothetical protein